MIESYRKWHKGYVTEIWNRRQNVIPPCPDLQLELGFVLAYSPSELFLARLMEARAWEKLQADLKFAFGGPTCSVSHHYWLLEDVEDTISREFDHHDLNCCADRCRREMAEHNFYASEKEDCLLVINSLRELASAMKFLKRAEQEAYDYIMYDN